MAGGQADVGPSRPHEADRRGMSSSRIPCVLFHDGDRTDGAFEVPPVFRAHMCWHMCGSALVAGGEALAGPSHMSGSARVAGAQALAGPSPHDEADRRGMSSSRIPCVLFHDGSRTDGAFQAPVVRTNTCKMCGSALLLAGGQAFVGPSHMCGSALLLAGGQADVGPSGHMCGSALVAGGQAGAGPSRSRDAGVQSRVGTQEKQSSPCRAATHRQSEPL